MSGNMAWYRDGLEGDTSTPHLTDPPHYLSPEELYKETGVKCEKIPDSLCDDAEALERLPSERAYKAHDYLEIDRKLMPDYEARLARFYSEHLHEDPEIRLFLEGGGFFEVRSKDEKWVRVHAQKGDLLDLPAGIWHRFCLDDKKYVRMLRLYKESPKWKAEFRNENPNPAARERYQNTMENIFKLQTV